MLPCSDPFVFIHIPKTGGTSLINTVRAMMPHDASFTEKNNRLSPAFTEALVAAKLPDGAFIHGHPDWGAGVPFRGKARFLTLLREPRRQLISHFLHALRDPAMPQHAAAGALGFRAFLRTFPHMIVCQTNCLYSAITDPKEERRRALDDPGYGDAFGRDRYFARQLGEVFDFLDEIALVGTLEEAETFLVALSLTAGWSHIPRLPHDNEGSRSQHDLLDSLCEDLCALEEDAELAPLFAIERAAYAKARALSKLEPRRAISRAALSAPADHKFGSFTVYASGLGSIVLGDNFSPERSNTTWWDGSEALSAAWWTGDRQLARLYVRRSGHAPCRLLIKADRLHALELDEVLICHGESWLPIRATSLPESAVLFSVTLPEHSLDFSLALYLQWNRYPLQPPFYPALRVIDFSLEPLADI